MAIAHPIIDSDGHITEPPDLWSTRMPAHLRDRAPQPADDTGLFWSVDGDIVPPRRAFTGQERRFRDSVESERFRDKMAKGFNPATQLEAMAVEGIHAAVLFPSHGLAMMGAAGADAVVTTAAARVYNEWLAEFCAADRNRLFGSAMIDPRDVDGAIEEAQRAATEYGFPAVFLRPNPVNGRNWHDPAYETLWSALEELGVAVCFHEGAAVTLPQVATDRYDIHAFWHACTHPMEQQMAMLSIVLGAVTERHPGLRFAFLECGAGWLPYWMWRLDETIEMEGRDFPELKLKPSEYIQRQCFVSIDSDEDPGIAAIEAFRGTPHVIWGSDYPHPDGKYPEAVKTLQSIPGMTPERFAGVVHTASIELFGKEVAAGWSADG